MNNKTFAIRALIVVIAVLVFISFSIGIAVALFKINIESGVNKISTSAANVSVKLGNSYKGTYNDDLNNTALFDDIVLAPGQKSAVKFIKIRNDSGSTVEVNNAKLINVTTSTEYWKAYIKLVNKDDFNDFDIDSFSNSDLKSLENGSELTLVSNGTSVSTNDELIIAMAIMLDGGSDEANDSVSFKVQATIDQAN
jgi:hypothetical protein